MAVSPHTCIQHLPARDARSPKRLSAPRAEASGSGHHPDVTLFGHGTRNLQAEPVLPSAVAKAMIVPAADFHEETKKSSREHFGE
jgi:hypothetical protein